MKTNKSACERFPLRPLRIFLAYFAVKDFDRKVRKGFAKYAKIGFLASWMLATVALPDCIAENPVPTEKIDHIFAGIKSAREPGLPYSSSGMGSRYSNADTAFLICVLCQD